ncbi:MULTISPECIES: transposase family protein [unclassified Streptomyces]|uniref:transposase family protein n=1 Tax=unclassified Streptomyces TaxID=2593676 RepID=UPI0022590E5E|nr:MULTISPECIES: transposase family protein [unclassified Streptomyces]MCX5053061.1 transposase family protein [Streptomyces sp. NBC_00474]
MPSGDPSPGRAVSRKQRRRTGADNRRNYSGKHKAHGLLFLALTDDKGRLLWLSAARPGLSSEITTARYNRLVERLRAHELGAIGDLGFTGLDDDMNNPVVITSYKAARTKPLTPVKKQVNKLIPSVRAVCEHAFAHLKNWRIITKVRLSTRYATTLLRALLVLTKHRSHPLTVRRSWATATALDQHEYKITDSHQRRRPAESKMVEAQLGVNLRQPLAQLLGPLSQSNWPTHLPATSAP